MAGKKTGKRMLTWVLVLVMALSLLPLNALATDGLETGGGSGMNFDKRADSNDDGTYTITMTAQATGTTTTTTKVKPMDIALVLDVSGSMDDTIPRRYKAIDADDVVTNETYYVYAEHHFIVTWHSYDKVTYCNDCKAFVDSAESHIIHKIGISLGLKHKYSPSETRFYTAITPIDKIDALKEAVNGFIDQVAKNSADSSIAVVSFASEAANVSGGLQPVKTNVDTLKAAVNNLYADGATRADLGMQEAARILDNGINSKKVVVMFTDGEPTSGNKFEKDVANATISAAKGMKDKGTEVFTVGVFDSDPDDKTYDYMNYVSSNYPNATSMNSGGKGSDERYYVTADSADSLSKVFEGISQTITKPAPVNDKLDEKTVITDTLSDHFTFARTEDGKVDVKVYAEKTDGSKRDIVLPEGPDGIDVKGKTVTVTGYNFSEHYQGIGGDDEEKLVIEIKVKPSGDGCREEEIPTNADTAEKHAAKVEVKSEDGTKTTPVTSHETAKVTGHQVIYELAGGEGDMTGNGLYYPQGAAVPVTDSKPTLEGHEFTGWTITKPDTDSLVINTDETTGKKTFTMPAADVTLTAQWTANKYTVTYELDATSKTPLSAGNLPTDSNEYNNGDTYQINSTYGNTAIDEGGYTYTFSGWKLNGAGPVLTGDQTMGNESVVLKGTWTKTPNKYSLSYNTNGGTISENANYTTKAGEVAFGIKLDTPKAADMTKEGYTFAGWYSDEDLNTPAPDTMPAKDLPLYAKWTPNSGTKYTVNHHQQNLNDDNSYTLVYTESDKTGTTGELTYATAENYEGFTAKPFEQKTIAANGSTVVDIYYDRNTYSVTYTDSVNDEPIFADEVHQSVKYGAPVPAYNNGTNPTRKNYTFAGWDSVVPETMPANNLTFTAQWEKNIIPTYNFDLTDLGITVYKNFVSKYGRSAEKSFTATATIEKETYTAEVDPNSPSNRSAATAEPTYIGEAIGTVTLKTDTTKAFDFGKDSNGKDSKFQLEPGDYRITVEETKGTDRYVTYDNARYTYTFTVTNEGKIVNINTPITCTFTNMYTKRHTAATPSKPTLNTGDHYAYVMGYPDGTVRPNGSITRAEVSAILFRLLSDKTRDEYFTTESSFTDVKAGAWYNNSIATLEKAGVIVDTAKGGAFRPNEAITRAELAAMLAQFSDAKPVKGVKFSDVSAEHWAYEAIAIAAKMGWIEGYPDGTFRPDATITRAEMMTLVNRALERVPSDEDHLLSKRVMLTFPDCKSGDWFYIAVQEATNSHTYERAATEKNGDEQWTALRANRDWTLLEK